MNIPYKIIPNNRDHILHAFCCKGLIKELDTAQKEAQKIREGINKIAVTENDPNTMIITDNEIKNYGDGPSVDIYTSSDELDDHINEPLIKIQTSNENKPSSTETQVNNIINTFSDKLQLTKEKDNEDLSITYEDLSMTYEDLFAINKYLSITHEDLFITDEGLSAIDEDLFETDEDLFETDEDLSETDEDLSETDEMYIPMDMQIDEHIDEFLFENLLYNNKYAICINENQIDKVNRDFNSIQNNNGTRLTPSKETPFILNVIPSDDPTSIKQYVLRIAK